MSRLDRLKEQFPSYNFSLIDAIKILDPSGKNTYSDFLLKMIANVDRRFLSEKEMVERISNWTGREKNLLTNLNIHQLKFLSWIVDMYFDPRDLEGLNKFEEYRKSGVINSVDISTFNDFEKIHSIVNVVDLKKLDKSMERQVRTIHEDEEWLIIRPLTHKSSMKYGRGTRWCTTQTDNPDYFQRYSQRGILIYSINKINGLKVGTFYCLDPYDKEFSFWDAKDNRVDSLESDLPFSVLTIIKNEIKETPKSNRDLLDESSKISEDSYYEKMNIPKLRAVEPMYHNVTITNETDVISMFDVPSGLTYITEQESIPVTNTLFDSL